MSSTPTEQTTFASLKLAQPILDALIADGYQFPTPIQAQAIPPALEARDVLGIAQTGTGKTAAFALPIINRLLQNVPRGGKLATGRKPKALILAPTRELAAQIADSFSSYGRHTPLRLSIIFGGVGQGPQVRTIQQGIDILVATPGRLIDLLDQRLISLSEIEFFVLDEADRMLDMGFIEPIRRISALLPRNRQTMLFSATMPKEIRTLANSLLHDAVTVTVTPVSSAVDRIAQKLFFVMKAQKTQMLIYLFDKLDMERTLVFTKTKHGADRLVRKLKAAGIHADAIHGDKAQNARTRALDAFRSGRTPVLVATDVAARGLDVDDITHVFNYDLPMEPEAYVHRIGRTARAGKSGEAISFCDVEEKGLLKDIERLTRFEIPRDRVPDSVPKTDEAAAKAGGPPVLRAEGRLSPEIETRSPKTAQQPGRRTSSTPAPRSHGPRIDRRMDEGRPEEPREVTPTQAPRPAFRGGAGSGRPNTSKPGMHPRAGSGGGTAGGRPSYGEPSRGSDRPNHARPNHGNPGSGNPSPRAQSGGNSSGDGSPAPKPGEPRPGAPRPGAPRPGAPRPGAPKPGAPKSNTPKPSPAKHAGPAPFSTRFNNTGKSVRGRDFKGGTGFKGPRP